jgi:hypothetical protein
MTRLAVRRECGFGCVICGEAICEYHHFDPPFEHAKEHAVSKIALLCGTCHKKASKPLLPIESVRRGRTDPYCLRKKTWHTKLDFSKKPLSVVLGAAVFIAPKSVLRINGVELLSIKKPECDGAPIQISGRFFDEKGVERLAIENNILEGDSNSWDVEWRGSKLFIRRAPQKVNLRLSISPDNNLVTIERLKMRYNRIMVDADAQWVRVNQSEEGVQFRGVVVKADSCLDIRQSDVGVE